MKDVDGVGCLDSDESFAGECEPGLVVEEIQNLDRAAVEELPRSRVQLPGLIGQLGLEANEGRLRTLVRLRRDESVAFEDAPDGGERRHPVDLADEVMGDGLGPSIVTAGDELLTKPQDLSLHVRGCFGKARMWPARPRL